MNLKPLNGWVLARVAISKVKSEILLGGDPTKMVTKFAVLESVSDEAAKAGWQPGDVVIAKTMHNVILNSGTFYRATFPIEEIIVRVEGVSLADCLGYDGKPFNQEANGSTAQVQQ